MDETPSPTNTWRILNGFSSIRNSLASYLSYSLSRRSPQLPPHLPPHPAAPSTVPVRRLSFPNGVDNKAEENECRSCCAKNCHEQLSETFLKRRRLDFELLGTKDRQYRSYVELHALAGTPALDSSKRKVYTRYALIASYITCIQ